MDDPGIPFHQYRLELFRYKCSGWNVSEATVLSPAISTGELDRVVGLLPDEKEALSRGPTPPFAITRHWLSLMTRDPDDPLRLQSVPTTAELISGNAEMTDPLGESDHSPLPRLIRRYPDRALIVVTGRCALYCRHCFRRRLTGDDFGAISREELADIAGWLESHQEVVEVLLSGGDPLTLKDADLRYLIRILRKARPDVVLRLATRIPVVEPERITRRLAGILGDDAALWVVLQVNHPRELSPRTLRAVKRLQRRGIPVINQSVLLKGVNDKLETLVELCRKLVSVGVKPYYLFQGDLASGTGHFRLPLEEARQLVDGLRKKVSGLAMPVFAVDLPGGGGKVPLGRDYVSDREAGGWVLHTPDGREGLYPDPE